MSPDERVQFARMLQQRAGGRVGRIRADDPREGVEAFRGRIVDGYPR